MDEKEKKYDSTVDTKLHIENIQRVSKPLMEDLTSRFENHDKSKLTSPELECYDKYVPMLKEVKYGTPGYFEVRQKMMDEGLKHHYEVNRHHPEHFKNGIEGMTLVDLVEFFCDTYAASLRSDTPFEKGFVTNCDKFHINGTLKKILLNTYEEYLKDKVK